MADNHKEDFLKQQADKALQLKKLHDDTLHMLQTEERFVNLLKGHNNQSVQSFIKQYAQMKVNWYTYAESNYENRLRKKNKWRDSALSRMRDIGLKKLFNLKCRWIAGEMDLEGIELSADFSKWVQQPFSCPYLEPISYEEFDCWLRFREEQNQKCEDDDDYADASPGSALENYHWYRSIYMDKPEELIPAWFHYYDQQFGTAQLMHLSTIRMDIEQDFNDLWTTEIYVHTLSAEQQKIFTHHNRAMRKELKENPAKLEEVRTENAKKWEEYKKVNPQYTFYSAWDRKIVDRVVELIEPPQVKKYYKAYRKWEMRSNTNEDAQMAIWGLNEAREWVAIESHNDYREALIKAYRDYSKRSINELLPVLFAEYRECIERNKPFQWSSNNSSAEQPSASQELKKRIFAVLQLQNRPLNLDFMKKENLKF